MVDHESGADAVLKRCTIGGFCHGGRGGDIHGGSAGWGILCWQLAQALVEDCLIEDAQFVGVSACHASCVEVRGSLFLSISISLFLCLTLTILAIASAMPLLSISRPLSRYS